MYTQVNHESESEQLTQSLFALALHGLEGAHAPEPVAVQENTLLATATATASATLDHIPCFLSLHDPIFSSYPNARCQAKTACLPYHHDGQGQREHAESQTKRKKEA